MNYVFGDKEKERNNQKSCESFDFEQLAEFVDSLQHWVVALPAKCQYR